MPPPRLPRHLRPCHPPGSAYRFCCASRTAHAQLLTKSRDLRWHSSQQPRDAAAQPADAPKKGPKKTWWAAAIDRISAFRSTSKTAADAVPPTVNTPIASSVSLVESTANATASPEPERRHRTDDERRAAPAQDEQEETSAPGQASPGLSSRMHISHREATKPQVRPLLKSVVEGTGTLHAHDASTDLPTGSKPRHTPKTQIPQTAPVTDTTAEHTATDDNATAIQQQLQQLLGQVRTLQAKLDAKPPSETAAPTPTSDNNCRVHTIEEQYNHSIKRLTFIANMLDLLTPRNHEQLALRALHYLRELARQADLENDQKTKASLERYKGVRLLSQPAPLTASHSRLQRAVFLSQRTYARSTVTLVRCANDLLEMRPSIVAQIRDRIHSRLVVIAGNAKKERDSKMVRRLSYYYQVGSLYANTDSTPSTITRAIVKPRKIYLDNVQESSSRVLPANDQDRHVKASKPVEADSDYLDNKTPTQKSDSSATNGENDEQRLTRQIHRKSRSMSSSDYSKIDNSITAKETEVPSQSETKSPKTASKTDEVSERSLLEELFPEASSPQPSREVEQKEEYPKLDLPEHGPLVRRKFLKSPRSIQKQMVESFQKRGEQITILQLAHCSTELTDVDFRRIIPKGEHIETWQRDGEFYKIIPGRDALSLERMPFYYLLFHTPESALAYQKNASRIHKLSALHKSSSIFSAVPPPKGFLESGVDLNNAISSYNLAPTDHHLSLTTVMQPYNPALRALFEQGGYNPIVPNTDASGQRIWKVLMHIEGYEPSHSDLFKILTRDAYQHGTIVPLRNESSTSLRRLRDIVNLSIDSQSISTIRPRAFDTNASAYVHTKIEDPGIKAMMEGVDDDRSAKEISQFVMRRVYNRWVLDFEDEGVARRFARAWHRRVLPDLIAEKKGWKDYEELRMCNTEVLW